MKEKVIYKIKTGSHLYGLNTPESDEDYGGIILPTPRQLLGIHKVEEIDLSSPGAKTDRRNTKEDTDEKYYSLDKFLKLLSNNNPNIVEFLFVPDNMIINDSEIMKTLRANADKFITKRVFKSFSGYAISQKKKMVVKRERFLNLQKGIKLIEGSLWDETDSRVVIDDVIALLLNNTLQYYKGDAHNCNSFQKGQPLKIIYDKLVHEYENYGWRLHTDTFETLGYDVKFGYHLLRLLYEGRELLQTGTLSFPIKGAVREDIMRIRNGDVSYDELLTMYEEYDRLCIEAYKNTTLRDKPDFKWIDEFQYQTYLKHIKR